jgi:hypothetical protein
MQTLGNKHLNIVNTGVFLKIENSTGGHQDADPSYIQIDTVVTPMSHINYSGSTWIK